MTKEGMVKLERMARTLSVSVSVSANEMARKKNGKLRMEDPCCRSVDVGVRTLFDKQRVMSVTTQDRIESEIYPVKIQVLRWSEVWAVEVQRAPVFH